MLSSLLGIQLVLLMGERIPRPSPAEIVKAIQGVDVTDSLEGDRGFRLTIYLDKSRRVDYPLLKHPLLQPLTRVVIAVVLGVKLEVLIDGIIDRYEFNNGQGDGNGSMTVFGQDLTTMMDLEPQNQSFGNQSSSSIVSRIINKYNAYGLIPQVTQTDDEYSETERVPQQTKSDLQLIRRLAKKHGFIFYIEPQTVGSNVAYWGPRDRTGLPPQPALTTNFGDSNNVNSLQISHDTLAPVQASVKILEPNTGLTIEVPIPELEDFLSNSVQITPASRTENLDSAHLDTLEALLAGVATQKNASNAVRGNGSLDSVRYGHVLRTQRTVGVRGVGLSFDGNYRVDKVTHQIRKGQYTQNFEISRKGLGTNQPRVLV